MVKIQHKVKFPCGYEYEIEMSSGWLDFVSYASPSKIEMPLCPIHQKKCKKVQYIVRGEADE